MKKRITSSPMYIMIRQFWQGNWRQLWLMSFVFAILLLFVHIFVLASAMTGRATQTVKEKLGVYFYIKDASQALTGLSQEEVSSRVIKFKDTLTSGGVNVLYFSKEDALNTLQQRLPHMIKSFDDYGIANPLPVTLYVLFRNQKQYDYVMETSKQYEDVLLTGAGSSNPSEQFDRNARILNVLHVLQYFFIFIIAACVVVLLLFFGMMITIKFGASHETIRVQKLLGSPFALLKKPFFINGFVLLVLGYIMAVILAFVFLYNLASIFPYLFGVTLGSLFGPMGIRLIWLFLEFIILSGVSRFYANHQLTRLLKKD